MALWASLLFLTLGISYKGNGYVTRYGNVSEGFLTKIWRRQWRRSSSKAHICTAYSPSYWTIGWTKILGHSYSMWPRILLHSPSLFVKRSAHFCIPPWSGSNPRHTPPRLCDSFSLFHRMHTSCPSRPSLSRILIPRRILNLTPHNHRPSGFLRPSLPLAWWLWETLPWYR